MENNIGKLKLSSLIPHLNLIAKQYDLKLNRVEDFKWAKLLLINLYLNQELWNI
jgi:hypothetical protein